MMRLAKAMGKSVVLGGNRDGFIGNRLFDRWRQEAIYLLEEGGSPDQIDTALEIWGDCHRILPDSGHVLQMHLEQFRVEAAL
jgi:hypothetical protein